MTELEAELAEANAAKEEAEGNAQAKINSKRVSGSHRQQKRKAAKAKPEKEAELERLGTDYEAKIAELAAKQQKPKYKQS